MTERSNAVGRRRADRRRATYEELIGHARRALAAGETLSLRAIAADMGLTPPALYRYVRSHAQLQARLSSAIYADVVARLDAAASMAEGAGAEQATARLVAVSVAFRAWALERPEEFRLVFAQVRGDRPHLPGGEHAGEAGGEGDDAAGGGPTRAVAAEAEGVPPEAAHGAAGAELLDDVPLTPWAVQFFLQFMDRLADMHHAGVTHLIDDCDVPEAATIATRDCLLAERPGSALARLPLPLWWVGLRYWVILCGVIRMEVDGYLPTPIVEKGILFCDVVEVWAHTLGVERTTLSAALAAGRPASV